MKPDIRLAAALAALREADNVLTDYIERLEKHGAMLNYGHSVLRQIRGAIRYCDDTAIDRQ